MNSNKENLSIKTTGSQPEDSFLVGRTIYLRSPNIEKDVINGEWHSWFNNQETTQFLVHGIFPVTKEDQIELVRSAQKDKSILLLCIISLETDEHVGVISLKNIDLLNRRAEIGIVTAPKKAAGNTGAFEAMGVLIKHAFYRLNLESLYASQHQGLWKWINSLSMLGFRINGFTPRFGIKNNEHYGIFHTSISAIDFLELERQRQGDILNPSPFQILRNRPRQDPTELFILELNNMNTNWLTNAMVLKNQSTMKCD